MFWALGPMKYNKNTIRYHVSSGGTDLGTMEIALL